MSKNKALASSLLGENADVIGRGVAKLMRKLVPSYQALDPVAVANSAAGFVRLIGNYLRDDDTTPLFATGRSMVALRKASGFATADMIIGVLVYLPVIRKVFNQKAPTKDAALAAADVVESVLLPLQAVFVRQLLSDDADGEGDAADTQENLVSLQLDEDVPDFMRD